jgi:ribose-phosphate pyrophosphokinase
VFILQSTCPPVNEHLIVLTLLADAARAAGADRVIAIVPYFGYARQEQRNQPGDARSAQVVSKLLGAVGIDHVVTLDLHSPALESAIPMPATLIQGDELFLPLVKRWELRDVVVVSPDAGGMKRAQRYAAALGATLAAISKQRTAPDRISTIEVLGDVRRRDCLIVDDMASTGRTLNVAADALRRAGAQEIHALFTHAVMAPAAEEQLLSAKFSRLLTSDSIPVAAQPWLQVLSVAPLLASRIRSLCGELGNGRGHGEIPASGRPAALTAMEA